MCDEDASPLHDPNARTAERAEALLTRLSPLLPQSPLQLSLGRRASVAVVLRQRKQQSDFSTCSVSALSSLEILFIQRAARPTDPWSAHIAFPGGHREPNDHSDLHAAMRETREEIGLDLAVPAEYRLLGRLSDRPIRRRNRPTGVLSAFVFLQMTSSNPELSPQPTEVAKAFWAPLDVLHGQDVKREHMLAMPMQKSWATEIWKTLGFARMRMPAVDVLSYANDPVTVADVMVPEVFLWGMTLNCVGDLVQSFGGRRVDWPAALPENRLFARVISVLADALWWVTYRGRRQISVRGDLRIKDSS